ncbi:MAG: hypothetical protein JW956_14305 [Calditrichaceae bacterium]|nr:hypothetical protein [Calditrichaceae bacterium]
MIKRILIIVVLFMCELLFAQHTVKEINFLKEYGLKYNAAGPIITKVDSLRNRLAVLHTNSSMVSVINCRDNSVTNIPIKSRGIQHLKDESMIIDNRSGIIYAIGNRCLHVVFPKQEISKTFTLDKQYEMIAVDENTGDAYLAGRESKRIAHIKFSNGRVSYLSWLEHEESLMNLNQTPPPSIRKIVFDNELKRVIAVDGFTSTLHTYDAGKRKRISERILNLETGARWHYAGYNQKTHHFYLVVENDKRQVCQAAKIDVVNEKDVIIELPGYTEGVGITYNYARDEIYIPYDNFASVHVVDFRKNGELAEIKLPLYGNDATAIDIGNDILYVACWAYGEIEVVDIKTRKFIHRIANLGIIPHMFNMSYNPRSERLYLPIGATAVNGTFGSAITVVNPLNDEVEKIYTGWAPKEIIQLPGKDEYLIFNAEDRIAHVLSDGSYTMHSLPFEYPIQAAITKDKNIYLSYGPHQSYWPNVYIWGAKNGILHIESETLHIMDRRIPRMAQKIAVDSAGVLYALQNSWGNENQFLAVMEDEIREFDARNNITLDAKIERETMQRILKYDKTSHLLYLVKIGETDNENGKLQIIDLSLRKMIKELEIGLNPVDLYFNDRFIYVSNFDSNTLSRIDKDTFEIETIKTDKKPFKLAGLDSIVYVINHKSASLQRFGPKQKSWKIPVDGGPDNLFDYHEKLIITAHNSRELNIVEFDPATELFSILHNFKYPYGEVSLDTNNNSFYLSGQFRDGIYELSKIRTDNRGRLWITDFLSGRLFIIY